MSSNRNPKSGLILLELLSTTSRQEGSSHGLSHRWWVSATSSSHQMQDGLAAHVMHLGYHGFCLLWGLVKRSVCCTPTCSHRGPCTVLGCTQAGARVPRREALRLTRPHRVLPPDPGWMGPGPIFRRENQGLRLAVPAQSFIAMPQGAGIQTQICLTCPIFPILCWLIYDHYSGSQRLQAFSKMAPPEMP